MIIIIHGMIIPYMFVNTQKRQWRWHGEGGGGEIGGIGRPPKNGWVCGGGGGQYTSKITTIPAYPMSTSSKCELHDLQSIGYTTGSCTVCMHAGLHCQMVSPVPVITMDDQTAMWPKQYTRHHWDIPQSGPPAV